MGILKKYYSILNNQCTFNIIFLQKISQKTNMLIKKGESKKKSKKNIDYYKPFIYPKLLVNIFIYI